MKEFLLFAWPHYYPGGGWNDYEDSYDTLEEAKAAASPVSKRGKEKLIQDHVQIVYKGEVVAVREAPETKWKDFV